MSAISEEKPVNPEIPENHDEEEIAEKTPPTAPVKPKLSKERLEHLAMMRGIAAAKKKELRTLRDKEKMIKQKTLEDRMRKVEQFEINKFSKEPEEPQKDSETDNEVQEKKKTKKKKKIIVDDSSDSDSSEDASAIKEFYKRKYKNKYTAKQTSAPNLVQRAAKDQLQTKYNQTMRDLAIKSVFPLD
jgi:hypothetical protein